MIIVALLEVVINLLNLLLSPFPAVPAFPEEVSSFLSTMVEYLTSGMSILYAFTYGTVLRLLLSTLVNGYIFCSVWKFIMWIIRKIPFLNIT